jgi:hypothetical protein
VPYKLSGDRVMVLKGGSWVVLKKHPSRDKALKHLAALKASTGDHVRKG